MPITVREIMQLKEFQNFTLIAGREGERNEIMNIGILDYEYANEDPYLEKLWAFGKGAFVISSLLFAKDHPERILSAVRGLCRDGVSALAIKTIYYETLPEEALAYADEHALPIYMFGRDDAYFQDIAILIRAKMEERDDTELLEQKIGLMVNGQMSLANIRNLSQEILPMGGYRSYFTVYCKAKSYSESIYYVRAFNTLRDRVGKRDAVFRFQNGYLVILDMEDRIRRGNLAALAMRILSVRQEDYHIGIGKLHETMDEFHLSMQEALYASQYAKLFGQNPVCFQQMGIYQILLPYCRSPWLEQYCRSILEPIREFDRQYDGELFRTAEIYVRKNGDVEEVAKELHLHRNTIRYRMSRVRELVGDEKDSRFDEQLSVAFRTYELQKL
ncbi:MAG: PucR family transcriptional regulator [Lachnospiraceae bacterium]|nr:PucR family transcriptional regulator [Lachnospiraceae bacterium]